MIKSYACSSLPSLPLATVMIIISSKTIFSPIFTKIHGITAMNPRSEVIYTTFPASDPSFGGRMLVLSMASILIPSIPFINGLLVLEISINITIWHTLKARHPLDGIYGMLGKWPIGTSCDEYCVVTPTASRSRCDSCRSITEFI